MAARSHFITTLMSVAILGCEATPPASAPQNPASASDGAVAPSGSVAAALPDPAAAAPSSAPRGPTKAIDAARVGALTGAKPETNDGIVKVSFPREDVPVEIDGWKKAPA